ncbi:MAG: hypothetical protein AAF334_10815, partial [Pseudomonadota bacterium]
MARRILLSEASGGGPKNLRFFAGRSLGEQDFRIMQDYVADRCAAVLNGTVPGVLWGFGVSHDGPPANFEITVQPGLAAGADGRAIRLHAPVTADWDDIIAAQRLVDGADLPQNGWFFLTIRRGTAQIDPPTGAAPCTRTELDILRDSRLETVASLGLQLVDATAELRGLPVTRAINRLGHRFLSDLPLDAETGAIPIALLRMDAGQIAVDNGETVLDPVSGRFLAKRHQAHESFALGWEALVEDMSRPAVARPLSLARTVRLDILPSTLGRSTIAVAEPSRFLPTTLAEAISRSSVAVTQPSRAVRTGLTERLSVAAATPFRLSRLFSTSAAFDAALPLSDIIGVDYLPSSGPLPEAMFTRLAGRPDGTGWTLPVMNFDPLD